MPESRTRETDLRVLSRPDECLAWALENPEVFGVWGWTTEKERRAMGRAAA